MTLYLLSTLYLAYVNRIKELKRTITGKTLRKAQLSKNTISQNHLMLDTPGTTPWIVLGDTGQINKTVQVIE